MEDLENKKHKIFVVDDNSENIKTIGSILRQHSFQVGFATNGHRAIEILNHNPNDYDLVLLDVNMPEILGFEVCRTLRTNPQLNDLPIIFLTANTDPEYIIEGFACGGQDYVTKPFNSGELLARIKTHIELRESRIRLKNMNLILDKKVRERTLELEEANKKLEVANRELEKLDEAKMSFLRLINHEINTPLNGIIGFTSILHDQLRNTQYFDYINYLSESALRLNEFVQVSLMITAMRTLPESYPFDQITLKEIIDDIIIHESVAIDQKLISIDVNCGHESPKITGNAKLLRICLSNILKNSIQNTPTGNQISLGCSSSQKKVSIWVEDTGPGFSAHAIQNLFKPFSLGDEHNDSKKGLGLHLVKIIVDYHQGNIFIENTKNGARVVIEFGDSLTSH